MIEFQFYKAASDFYCLLTLFPNGIEMREALHVDCNNQMTGYTWFTGKSSHSLGGYAHIKNIYAKMLGPSDIGDT